MAEEKDKVVSFRITTDRAGNVYIRDLDSGRYIDMIRQGNGNYSVSGSESLIRTLAPFGGVNELVEKAKKGEYNK